MAYEEIQKLCAYADAETRLNDVPAVYHNCMAMV